MFNLQEGTTLAFTAKSSAVLPTPVSLDEFSTVLAAASNTVLIKEALALPGSAAADTITSFSLMADTIHSNAATHHLPVELLSTSLDSNFRHSTYRINDANGIDTISIELLYPLMDTTSVGTLVKTDADSQRMAISPARPCVQLATQSDLDSLMRDIQFLHDTSDKINLAVRRLQEKCFDIAQIRILTYVFSEEADKCALLLAAYPYTPDPVAFKTLKSVLNDEKNIKAFTERVL